LADRTILFDFCRQRRPSLSLLGYLQTQPWQAGGQKASGLFYWLASPPKVRAMTKGADPS
jgi:hypothetical protein